MPPCSAFHTKDRVSDQVGLEVRPVSSQGLTDIIFMMKAPRSQASTALAIGDCRPEHKVWWWILLSAHFVGRWLLFCIMHPRSPILRVTWWQCIFLLSFFINWFIFYLSTLLWKKTSFKKISLKNCIFIVKSTGSLFVWIQKKELLEITVNAL